MDKRLELNEEQKALLAEWNILKEKMDKADMMFFWDDFDGGLVVVNGEKVSECMNDPFDEPEKGMEEVEPRDLPWDNFELPNYTRLTNDDQLFMRFDNGIEERMMIASMESAAL